AAPAAVAMGTPSSAALPVNSSVPVQAPANTNAYTHTIASGESLYTIARKYDVTTQAIVHANGLSSPDKIVVGQKIVIPGRADLVTTTPVQVASTAPQATAPSLPASRPANLSSANVLQAAATPAPAATTPAPAQAEPTPAPTQVASVPAAEPVPSGSDKFHWPV